MPPPDAGKLEDAAIDRLLEAVFARYGHDFRGYSRASLARRIGKRIAEEQMAGVDDLRERVVQDADVMARLLIDLTVNVTEMFRDPGFYRAFRRAVVPTLATYPFIRIWHAGCSTGEEVYSLAILLTEEGLYGRSRIYATDVSEHVLERARQRIVHISGMKEASRRYAAAGGAASLGEYYTAMYDGVLFDAALTTNVVFAVHNLVTDASFNEFNVILCRNVMIYFGRPLQARVYGLIHDSLAPLGVLALGDKESLRFSPHEGCYERLDEHERIYRRVR